MKNIYTPADIERITEATIGTLDDISRMSPPQQARACERRAAFIATVGEQAAIEVLDIRGDKSVLVFAGDGICGA